MRSNAQPNKPASQHRPGTLMRGKTLGIGMVLAGALLLTLISGYYAYSASARSQLDELNFTVEQPSQSVRSAPAVSSIDPLAENTSLSKSVDLLAVAEHPAGVSTEAQTASPPVQRTAPPNQRRSALPAISYSTLYPATHIHPKFWGQPLWAGGEPYKYSVADPGTGLPDGFRAASAADDALVPGNGSLTTRIAIPLIDVNSETKELEILNFGDSRAYETPKHLVGHIPQSPNPGEIGNAWYFGHLESPIKGEGNVFQRLPEIPDLLRDGDAVFVELEGADGRVFLYRTTRTEVVHEDDLELYGSDVAQITLVACVPRLVYDHRIVVTAELVGVKDALDTVN